MKHLVLPMLFSALAMGAFSPLRTLANDDPSVSRAGDGLRIELWPADKLVKLKTPETASSEGRGGDATHPDRLTRNVSVPTITVFLPKNATAQTPAVVICPGGGYAGLAIDKEGYDVARFLAKNGIAGIALKYRLPHPEITGTATPWPMLDVTRAMQIARSRAKEWHIDPNAIGVMGFSAGGHLAAWAATSLKQISATASLDPIHDEDPRPNFAALIYPVVSMENGLTHGGSQHALLGKAPDAKLQEAYSPEKHVTKLTPPIFIVCAADDPAVNPKTNALLLKKVCDAAGVPCELHEYPHGGHGFGMGVRGGEGTQWPALFAKWLRGLKH